MDTDRREIARRAGTVDFLSYYMQLERLQTIRDIFDAIRERVRQFAAIAERRRDRLMKSKIHQAVEYMEQHYAREGLSLQEVAGVVYVSPT